MAKSSDFDRARMDRATRGLPTKAAKIRELASAGFPRAQIAAYLGIRYQHVRNVLTQPHAGRAARVAPQRGLGESEPSPAYDLQTVEEHELNVLRFRLDEQ